MTTTNFLVAKGWEGFADRLQCLSYALTTALRYNRVLYVDWTDDIWGEDFYQYFCWENLPHITSYTDIPKSCTVYPRFWQNQLMVPDNNWVYDWKNQLVFDPATTNDFSDVWVQSGIGHRAFDMPLLCQHLRLQPNLIPMTEPLVDLPVVHLRGNDRKFTESDWERVRTLAPIAYVLSDDVVLIERWKSVSPKSHIISTPQAQVTHLSVGVDKREMNKQLLSEFFLLAQAKTAYALNENSLYFSMARMLGSCSNFKSLFSKQPQL